MHTNTSRRIEPDVPVLRVVVAKEGGGPSATYEFFQPTISFGRAPGADIRLDADNISRLHCTVEIRADGVWVRDLGSLNGVYMDGERIREAIITPKSVVSVGPFRFRARQEAELPASRTPAPEPSNEWTKPSTPIDAVAPRADRIAAQTVPLDAPISKGTAPTRPEAIAPPAVRAPSPTFTRSTPIPAPAAQPTPARAKAPSRGPQPRKARMGDTCNACHDGTVLTWGDELRCRACWNDGNPVALAVKLGETCPCCHQGLMLKWEGGLRCRNCGNRGHSLRQPQPAGGKLRAGSKCPSCAETDLLTWNGGIRCHGCGQAFR